MNKQGPPSQSRTGLRGVVCITIRNDCSKSHCVEQVLLSIYYISSMLSFSHPNFTEPSLFCPASFFSMTILHVRQMFFHWSFSLGSANLHFFSGSWLYCNLTFSLGSANGIKHSYSGASASMKGESAAESSKPIRPHLTITAKVKTKTIIGNVPASSLCITWLAAKEWDSTWNSAVKEVSCLGASCCKQTGILISPQRAAEEGGHSQVQKGPQE